MISKLTDDATYFLFSWLIISVLTKHLGFESLMGLNTDAVISRYLLLRKINYGQFKCTVVFSMSQGPQHRLGTP